MTLPKILTKSWDDAMPSTATAPEVLAQDRHLRYRLDVIASDVAALVQAAGGWLYHRVAIGWDVTVMVPPERDPRPLQILGVHTADLETGLSAPGETSGHGLAVVADPFVADPRIRQRVQLALRHSLTEVVLWGDSWPAVVNHRLAEVRHVPTVAGRAFKRQALLAAEVTDAQIDSPERFYSDQMSCLPGDSDLVPVG